MCLRCAKKELPRVWRCTETRHFLKCSHVVDTQPSTCAYNCRNVPRAQPRDPHRECPTCDTGGELFKFLHALYPIKVLEDDYLLRLEGPVSLSEEEREPMRTEIREKKEKLRRQTPRIFWLAYSRNGSTKLHKLLWLHMRYARRRQRAERRRKYIQWLNTKERESAMFFAKGLHWLRKKRPHIVVKKMSERPSRFEDYVQLRAPANDPYDLTELRYRIGIIDKVCRYCGYDEVTAWKNADKGKVEILYYLIKDANPCLGEALPLDIMEHLQDIMNDYKDDPLGFYEGVEEQVQQIMNSDGEFEDEVDEASPEQDSYWARINGSMDIIQELGAEPFDSPDASSPDSDSSDGDSSVGSQQPPRTPPYLRQDDDLLSQSSSGSVY